MATYNFNTANDFSTYFSADAANTGTAFTESATAGLGGGQGILINGVDRVYGENTGYTVVEGKTYQVSIYAKNNLNNGYGSIGFSVDNAPNGTNGASPVGDYGAPQEKSIGFSYAGGGGWYINNTVDTSQTQAWAQVVGGNWYYLDLSLTLTNKAAGTWSVDYKIYNSDPGGTVGSLHSQTTTTLTNTDLSSATTIYAYFGQQFTRVSNFDNFSSSSDFLPSITSATYDASTGVLSVTGANLINGGTVDASKLTVTGQGGATYTLAGTYSVTASSTTAFAVTLDATDKVNVNGLLNKTGTSAVDATTFNLAAAASWMAGASADATSNGVTVSNITAPTITSATYDATTGVLTVTGTNLVKASGSPNDITPNKFTFTGEGGSTYTLNDTAYKEITSGTSFSLTLSFTDMQGLHAI